MNPFQTLGQFTPFVPPDLAQFERKAPTSTLLGRLPYLSLFENWFKYPILVTGRAIVSIIITIFLAGLTLSPTYQTFIQENIIDRWLPQIELKIEQGSDSGNLIEDFWNNATGTFTNAKSVAEREVIRNATYQALAGESFVIVRGIVIFLLYSLLFWLFGTNISSLEKLALQRQANLGLIAKSLLHQTRKQADYWQSQRLIPPTEYQNLTQVLSKALDAKKPLSQEEIDYLCHFHLAQTQNHHFSNQNYYQQK
jgi:hypothetical protein